MRAAKAALLPFDQRVLLTLLTLFTLLGIRCSARAAQWDTFSDTCVAANWNSPFRGTA